jgi:hypothetical protein
VGDAVEPWAWDWQVPVPYVVRPAPRPLGARPVILPDGPRDRAEPATVWERADPDGLVRALGGEPGEDPADVSARATAAARTDVVVLVRTGSGALAAELLDVAVPSGWDPRARAGSSLPELHAPVGGNERLQGAARPIAEMILTKGPFEMFVWGLQADGRIARWPGPQDWADDPGDWWLRVERQVTVPLPHLDRALFWLRPCVQRVGDMPPRQRRRLADAVASMRPEHLAYKGFPESAAGRLATR